MAWINSVACQNTKWHSSNHDIAIFFLFSVKTSQTMALHYTLRWEAFANLVITIVDQTGPGRNYRKLHFAQHSVVKQKGNDVKTFLSAPPAS